MVSNNYNDPNSKKFDTPIHEHFEHYYSISSRATVGREDDIFMPSAARLWPIFLDSNRGECEEYLKSFEEVVYGITELEDGLHNQRECDLAAFSGH